MMSGCHVFVTRVKLNLSDFLTHCSKVFRKKIICVYGRCVCEIISQNCCEPLHIISARPCINHSDLTSVPFREHTASGFVILVI